MPGAAPTPTLSLPLVVVLAEWYGNTDACAVVLGPFADRAAADAGVRSYDDTFWDRAGVSRADEKDVAGVVRFPSMDEAGFSFPRFSVYAYDATVGTRRSGGVSSASAGQLLSARRTNIPTDDDSDGGTVRNASAAVSDHDADDEGDRG